MLAVDLTAWTQHLLLHGDLAMAEPKTLRYRLLHVAARLTRGTAPALVARHPTLLALGPPTWLPRSPGSPRCPFPPVDLPSRHDERREPPAEQHAGDLTAPVRRSDPTEINTADHKISSRLHE